MKTTRQLYCQYLLSSQINYTCTNLAEHFENLDHNSIYRYLKTEKLTPRLLWEKVKDTVVYSPHGAIIFDDTVLDKSYSSAIEGVRRQYSGNEHAIIKGIGLVNCVYYNPEADRFWVLDYRLFDPERDGKTKLNHVSDMLDQLRRRAVAFRFCLMDSWYATTALMTRLIKEEKIFYCPLKKNRLVDDSFGEEPYRAIETLEWTEHEMQQGKIVKVKKFAQDTRLKMFRVTVSTNRTDYIVTNDLTQSDTDEAQKVSGQRWKIEQFHREAKQLTGIERCQCRLNRSQRNHIASALLVWLVFKELADKTAHTVYQLKHGLLSDYLKQQLRNPAIAFS
ncbi:MAG: transposase [Acidobacteria bacterium]|nr:transposase [Acidobacteriota bacterium]